MPYKSEKQRRYTKEWRARNPEKLRQYELTSLRRRKAEVFALLGEECVKCGFSDSRALQIDHINGGGAKHRKTKRGRSFYEDVLRVDGDGYQVLCANCNWIKRHERKEGPYALQV